MSYYYNILSRQIERGTKTKGELQKNVALWQIYGLVSDAEFMQLMELIDTKYPELVPEQTIDPVPETPANPDPTPEPDTPAGETEQV